MNAALPSAAVASDVLRSHLISHKHDPATHAALLTAICVLDDAAASERRDRAIAHDRSRDRVPA